MYANLNNIEKLQTRQHTVLTVKLMTTDRSKFNDKKEKVIK